MKISRASDNLQAYQVEQLRLDRQRRASQLESLERKKHDARVQETRSERAKRLQLDRGRNIDLDC